MATPQQPVTRFSWKRMLVSVFLMVAGTVLCTDRLAGNLLDFSSDILHRELNRPFRQAGLSFAGEIMLITGVLLGMKDLFFSNRSPAASRKFMLPATGSVMLLFFSHLLTDAVNVPIWDDYATVLDFLSALKETVSLQAGFGLIAQPFYESRMVLLRLFCTAWWALTGEINFRYLVLSVNACYLFLFLLWLRLMFPAGKRRMASLPVALLIFQFQSYDTILWATAGFNFMVTFLMALLSMVFITRKGKWALPLAIFFALSATLTYGNGWLAFAVILGYLFYLKQFKRAAWTAGTALILAFWYFGIPSEGPHHGTAQAIWFHYPVYYFSFCGSAFRFFNRVEPAFLAGVFIHILLWICWRKGLMKGNPILAGMIFFILLSAMLTAFFRTADGGISQALSPRYGFYSQWLILQLLTMYLQKSSWQNAAFPPAWLITVLIGWQLVSAFMFYPEAAMRRNTLLNYIKPWQQQPGFDIEKNPVNNPWIFGANPLGTINGARARGIYHPE